MYARARSLSHTASVFFVFRLHFRCGIYCYIELPLRTANVSTQGQKRSDIIRTAAVWRTLASISAGDPLLVVCSTTVAMSGHSRLHRCCVRTACHVPPACWRQCGNNSFDPSVWRVMWYRIIYYRRNEGGQQWASSRVRAPHARNATKSRRDESRIARACPCIRNTHTILCLLNRFTIHPQNTQKARISYENSATAGPP